MVHQRCTLASSLRLFFPSSEESPCREDGAQSLNAEISTKRKRHHGARGWSVINFRRIPEILPHAPERFKRASWFTLVKRSTPRIASFIFRSFFIQNRLMETPDKI